MSFIANWPPASPRRPPCAPPSCRSSRRRAICANPTTGPRSSSTPSRRRWDRPSPFVALSCPHYGAATRSLILRRPWPPADRSAPCPRSLPHLVIGGDLEERRIRLAAVDIGQFGNRCPDGGGGRRARQGRSRREG